METVFKYFFIFSVARRLGFGFWIYSSGTSTEFRRDSPMELIYFYITVQSSANINQRGEEGDKSEIQQEKQIRDRKMNGALNLVRAAVLGGTGPRGAGFGSATRGPRARLSASRSGISSA